MTASKIRVTVHRRPAKKFRSRLESGYVRASWAKDKFIILPVSPALLKDAKALEDAKRWAIAVAEKERDREAA